MESRISLAGPEIRLKSPREAVGNAFLGNNTTKPFLPPRAQLAKLKKSEGSMSFKIPTKPSCLWPQLGDRHGTNEYNNPAMFKGSAERTSHQKGFIKQAAALQKTDENESQHDRSGTRNVSPTDGIDMNSDSFRTSIVTSSGLKVTGVDDMEKRNSHATFGNPSAYLPETRKRVWPDMHQEAAENAEIAAGKLESFMKNGEESMWKGVGFVQSSSNIKNAQIQSAAGDQEKLLLTPDDILKLKCLREDQKEEYSFLIRRYWTRTKVYAQSSEVWKDAMQKLGATSSRLIQKERIYRRLQLQKQQQLKNSIKSPVLSSPPRKREAMKIAKATKKATRQRFGYTISTDCTESARAQQKRQCLMALGGPKTYSRNKAQDHEVKFIGRSDGQSLSKPQNPKELNQFLKNGKDEDGVMMDFTREIVETTGSWSWEDSMTSFEASGGV